MTKTIWLKTLKYLLSAFCRKNLLMKKASVNKSDWMRREEWDRRWASGVDKSQLMWGLGFGYYSKKSHWKVLNKEFDLNFKKVSLGIFLCWERNESRKNSLRFCSIKAKFDAATREKYSFRIYRISWWIRSQMSGKEKIGKFPISSLIYGTTFGVFTKMKKTEEC